jgi:hypothetical protein
VSLRLTVPETNQVFLGSMDKGRDRKLAAKFEVGWDGQAPGDGGGKS